MENTTTYLQNEFAEKELEQFINEGLQDFNNNNLLDFHSAFDELEKRYSANE